MKKSESDTDVIVRALESLKGLAHLSDIYKRVNELSPKKIADDTVRGRLEDHSSDYKVWINGKHKRPDLFANLQIGSGWWALREFEIALKRADSFEDEAELSAKEGELKLRVHLKRERSKKLIAQFKSRLKSFECSVCGFDFEEKYGDVGRGFIEAHHSVPVARVQPGNKTKISDLVAVCSNCHRMLHTNGLLDWKILKSRLSTKKKASDGL